MEFIRRWIRRHRGVGAVAIAICLAFATVASAADTKPAACVRIMEQDASRNNLVDPPDYKTAPPNTLGGVIRAGNGTRPMILIPGAGFGGDIFEPFMADFTDDYRMFAVTLAGFGGTAAPASPPEGTSFGEQTWTNSAVAAIEQLIADEQLDDVVLVGHWVTGTQVALRLALKHPDTVRAVVLLSGSARFYSEAEGTAAMTASLEARVKYTDLGMAPHWFKTVTRETWDDNNYLPGDYAAHPVMGLRLWRMAAEPPLHVWVRYLCEFNAQDITEELGALKVPTLLLKPGLEGVWFDSGQNYMDWFCHKSWAGRIESHPAITATTIPDARCCMWYDQPAAVREAVVGFLHSAE